MAQNPGTWEHSLQHAALSDTGLRRTNNQDALAVVIADSQEAWSQRGHLFMVADGMGAHAAGELASRLATDSVALTYCKLVDLSPPEAILKAMQEANRQIFDRGESDPGFRGMGTTSTVLLLLPQGAVVAHVGDSRAYRLRGHRLEQLTFDHSLLWEMRAAGQMPDSEIEDFIPKNIITRSLGPGPDVQVDLEGPFPIAPGDTYLVCSDGLSGPLDDNEIGTILGALQPAEAVEALVSLANLRGGPDNITAVVVRVTDLPPTPAGDLPAASMRRRSLPRPVHPLLWTLLGVFALAAGGAALMQFWGTALIGLAAAAAAGVTVLAKRYGGREPDCDFDRKPLGNGPYSDSKCEADEASVGKFSEVVEQLREAAFRKDWKLDWFHFNNLLAEATAARQAADHAEAVRQYIRAASFMMAQLKLQRGSGGDRGLLGQ
jgi:serine/threonine protein phosphatase PrpC